MDLKTKFEINRKQVVIGIVYKTKTLTQLYIFMDRLEGIRFQRNQKSGSPFQRGETACQKVGVPGYGTGRREPALMTG